MLSIKCMLGIDNDLIERFAELDIEEEAISGNRKLLDSALSVLSENDQLGSINTWKIFGLSFNYHFPLLDDLVIVFINTFHSKDINTFSQFCIVLVRSIPYN